MLTLLGALDSPPPNHPNELSIPILSGLVKLYCFGNCSFIIITGLFITKGLFIEGLE